MQFTTELNEYFDKLDLQGIHLSEGQKLWYSKKKEVLQEDMSREFPSYPDEAFESSQIGNWYASQMKELYDKGRVTTISYDKALPVNTAFDLGQADFLAIFFFQINRAGEIMVIDYFQKSDFPIDQIAQMLTAKGYTYGTHIWPHDARARDRAGITFEQQARNYNLAGLVLEQSGFLDGVNLVRSTLSKCWFDGVKCREGLLCLENYKKKWNNQIGGFTSDAVHDEYSHGCFIGETLIDTDKGKKRIDSIRIGDKVLTPNGYKNVLKTFEYESNDLIEITTSTCKITCTKNHKIFSNKGLVYADALRYNDVILDTNWVTEWKKIGFLGEGKNLGFRDYFLSMKMKQSFTLMDINIFGMKNIIEKEFRIHHLFQHFTELFGLTIMGKYLKHITFIIWMVIQKIMIYQIYSSFQLVNIPNYICKTQEEEKQPEKAFIKQWNMQKNGMDQKKEGNGIKNTLKNVGLEKELHFYEIVTCVERNISRMLNGVNSVPMVVKQKIDINQESTINQGNVKSAEPNLHATNMLSKEHVVRNVPINLQTIRKVYDFEVEDDHCYFANGLLVSNSDAFRYLCCGLQKINDNHKIEDDMKAVRYYFG